MVGQNMLNLEFAFFLFLFSHGDKQCCSWSRSMQHLLSVTSRDTKCSHAKQPGHFQVVGQYFIFISLPKKVQALLYAYREGENKGFSTALKMFTGTKALLQGLVYLLRCKNCLSF